MASLTSKPLPASFVWLKSNKRFIEKLFSPDTHISSSVFFGISPGTQNNKPSVIYGRENWIPWVRWFIKHVARPLRVRQILRSTVVRTACPCLRTKLHRTEERGAEVQMKPMAAGRHVEPHFSVRNHWACNGGTHYRVHHSRLSTF